MCMCVCACACVVYVCEVCSWICDAAGEVANQGPLQAIGGARARCGHAGEGEACNDWSCRPSEYVGDSEVKQAKSATWAWSWTTG